MSGCSTSPRERGARVFELAAAQGWQPLVFQTADFAIQAFVPGQRIATPQLNVYIEGDGLAWLDRHTPSFAPTPADPLALRLAMADASASAVYLARPCQYTLGPDFRNCQPRYWTSHRFAPEMVETMDQALDQLLQAQGARQLVLIGYSGGAAMAALLAARRHDVVGLVTVAGVLDAQAWTKSQRLSALSGSLDPREVASRLTGLPQWHFVGGRDQTVPAALLEGFLGAQQPLTTTGTVAPSIHMERDFDHHCCWVKTWPEWSRTFAPTTSQY
ncbi:MAG TPA: alpha/beta hydrolase [Hydrogenophaga sp.]|nr:alpha/beta hydrolase [Hydrogenophaga sp.]